MFEKLKSMRRFATEPLTVPSAPVMVSDEEVHAEVYGASEILEKEMTSFVAECNDILEESEVVTAKQLDRLGFGQAKNVRPTVDKERERANAKQWIEILNSYKTRYPFYKFIAEKTALSICEKYNLILAPAQNFIGELPVKNQTDILNFKVKSTDIYKYDNDYARHGYSGLERDSYCMGLNGREMLGTNLMIIAPKDQLNIRATEQIIGHRVVSTDPIVLQPVEHGFLIVTAWGAESNDTEIQNEALN